MAKAKKKSYLVLIEHIPKRNSSSRKVAKYLCKVCDQKVVKRVSHVNSGEVRTCSRKCGNIFKPEAVTKRPEYSIWLGMKNRCTNKSYNLFHRYGGRGIKVCDRWKESFTDFISDVGDRPSSHHSLDRIDNNGDYSPENCQWATAEDQANNTIKNINIEAYGIKMSVARWCRVLEIKKERVYYRLKIGWSDHDSLFTPQQGKNGKVLNG